MYIAKMTLQNRKPSSVDHSMFGESNPQNQKRKYHRDHRGEKKPKYSNMSEIMKTLIIDRLEVSKLRNCIDEWFKEHPNNKVEKLSSRQEKRLIEPLLLYLSELFSTHFTDDDTADFIKITLQRIVQFHIQNSRRNIIVSLKNPLCLETNPTMKSKAELTEMIIAQAESTELQRTRCS